MTKLFPFTFVFLTFSSCLLRAETQSLAYGNFSEFNQANQEADNRPVQTYEAVLEFDYRIQLNKWAYVQPFIEYVIRPGGAGIVGNATVLGLHFRVNF